MRRNTHKSLSIFFFTLSSALIALLLSILPLPERLTSFRPAWLAIFIIYYAVAFPRFAVLSFAWCLGIVLDVLYGSVLGMHALSLVVVAYLSHLFYKQMRLQSLWQQAIGVFIFVLLYQFLCLFIKAIIGEPFNSYTILFGAMSSMLIWPLLASILLRAEKLIY